VFDGIQVRGIGREKEQRSALARDERMGLYAFVEGNVVYDHDMCLE
jgi:hypothetical protein